MYNHGNDCGDWLTRHDSDCHGAVMSMPVMRDRETVTTARKTENTTD